jgi:F0F1-type ATP synthase assembly protein I
MDKQPLLVKKNNFTQKNSKTFHALFLAWQLGFLIAIPIVVCLLLGIAGDHYFHTKPLLLLLGLLLGLAITVYEIYRVVIPLVTHPHTRQ